MPWESPESVSQSILNRLRRKDFRSEHELTNYLVSRIRQVQIEIREACVWAIVAFSSESSPGERDLEPLIRALREKVRVEDEGVEGPGDNIGRRASNLQPDGKR